MSHEYSNPLGFDAARGVPYEGPKANHFDWRMLSEEDYKVAMRYLGSPREPDLIIAPDGKPYLYRWHLQVGDKGPGMYFHVQVAGDPERPLHDHPWDNMSVILGGAGYVEMLQTAPPYGYTQRLIRITGDVIFRRASEAHRLLMPEGSKYTITQFSFGPKINEWGFWYPGGVKRNHKEVTELKDGVSVHLKNAWRAS